MSACNATINLMLLLSALAAVGQAFDPRMQGVVRDLQWMETKLTHRLEKLERRVESTVQDLRKQLQGLAAKVSGMQTSGTRVMQLQGGAAGGAASAPADSREFIPFRTDDGQQRF